MHQASKCDIQEPNECLLDMGTAKASSVEMTGDELEQA